MRYVHALQSQRNQGEEKYILAIYEKSSSINVAIEGGYRVTQSFSPLLGNTSIAVVGVKSRAELDADYQASNGGRVKATSTWRQERLSL